MGVCAEALFCPWAFPPGEKIRLLVQKRLTKEYSKLLRREEMIMKRFIVELGTGTDLHGGDVTQAAKRAISDALSHGCLCGLTEILNINELEKVHVVIKIGCPNPEQIQQDELLKLIPFGKASIDEVVTGGLSTRGIHVDSFGQGDQIIVAVASLSVFVEQ